METELTIIVPDIVNLDCIPDEYREDLKVWLSDSPSPRLAEALVELGFPMGHTNASCLVSLFIAESVGRSIEPAPPCSPANG